MATYLTNGFVLRARAHKQNDRMYTVFTERRGKLDLVATSSRKILSKLAPHLVPFGEIELMIAIGKKRDKLAGASLKKIYLKPPYNLNTAVLGSAFLEVTEVLTSQAAPEPDIFIILKYYLSLLKNLPDDDVEWRETARTIFGKFIFQVLQATGLSIHITRCQGCQGELAVPALFSFKEHGFFHGRCLKDDAQSMSLGQEALTFLHKLSNKHEQGQTFNLPKELVGFLVDYVQGQSGKPLYTLKVLRSIL